MTKMPDLMLLHCCITEPQLCSIERWILACATDETKLWLIPSVKQHRNPCSGSPAVYLNSNMRHNWSVKNAIDCQFVSQVERKYKMHFWQFIESIKSPEQGYQHYFTDVTNQVKINHLSVMQCRLVNPFYKWFLKQKQSKKQNGQCHWLTDWWWRSTCGHPQLGLQCEVHIVEFWATPQLIRDRFRWHFQLRIITNIKFLYMKGWVEIKIRTRFTMLLQGSRNGEVIGMGSIQSPQVLMCDDLVVGSVLSYPVFILQYFSFTMLWWLVCFRRVTGVHTKPKLTSD